MSGGELASPDAPEFDNGTLIWTDCVADAILLRAWEEAYGNSVTLLSDEHDDFFGGIVVLSSRNINGLF